MGTADPGGHVRLLYTISQIEDMLGYARDSLTSLRSKGYFPQPDEHYGRTPLWAQATVDQWVSEKRWRIDRKD